MSCYKIMMHLIFSKVSTQMHCIDMTGKWIIRVRMQQGVFFLQ